MSSTPIVAESSATLDLPAVSHAQGQVRLPGSKSISNRTLLLAALAAGDTALRGLLHADDVTVMIDALRALGVAIDGPDGAGNCTVHGTGGRFPVREAALFLGNAGTAFRPLTAALALSHGDYVLRGVSRMHERPIGDLVDALRLLGANIRYLGQPGFPPLAIDTAAALSAGAQVVPIRGDVSSQFLSSLLMALPLLTARSQASVTVDVIGGLISQPYVAITTKLMRRFGVIVEQGDARYVVPAAAHYASPGTVVVEGDASGASYFLAAGVIGGGPVRVIGVDRRSIQGDVAFADVLARMGGDIRGGEGWLEAHGGAALEGATIDCMAIPDAAMTLAVVALFARGPTLLTQIGSWRVKETDRIAAMATELRKLGAAIDAGDDFMRITPPQHLQPATIDTYDDHRIAMCLALASLGNVAIRINDPGCVRKTYPDFFAAFGALTVPMAG
ncbi:MAG: 3-phosphoshikimate 1-carboxyvinyltransferase [Betaproteobacteria bacterium]